MVRQIVNLQPYRSLLRDLKENIFWVIVGIVSFGMGILFFRGAQWKFLDKRDLKQEQGIVAEIKKKDFRGRERYDIKLIDGRECFIWDDAFDYFERDLELDKIQRGDKISFLISLEDHNMWCQTLYVNNRKILSYNDRYEFELAQYESLGNKFVKMTGIDFIGIALFLMWGSVNDPWDNGIKTLHGKRRKIKKEVFLVSLNSKKREIKLVYIISKK